MQCKKVYPVSRICLGFIWATTSLHHETSYYILFTRLDYLPNALCIQMKKRFHSFNTIMQAWSLCCHFLEEISKIVYTECWMVLDYVVITAAPYEQVVTIMFDSQWCQVLITTQPAYLRTAWWYYMLGEDQQGYPYGGGQRQF